MLELTINGVQYRSMAAAAKALGINVSLLSRRVNGLAEYETLDQPPSPSHSHSTKPIPITINGKSFASISEAARFYDVSNASFFLAIKHALETGEDELFVGNCKREFHPGNQVTIQGKTYVSWTEAARDLGVCYPTFVSRMKRGYYSDAPKQTNHHNGTPLVVNGVRYQSRREFAAAYGIKETVLGERLMNGAGIETALDDKAYDRFVRKKMVKNAEIYEPNGKIKVYAFGRGFSSYAECARAFGLRPGDLRRRMKSYNLTVEQAIDDKTFYELSEKFIEERKRARKLEKMGLAPTEEYIW